MARGGLGASQNSAGNSSGGSGGGSLVLKTWAGPDLLPTALTALYEYDATGILINPGDQLHCRYSGIGEVADEGNIFFYLNDDFQFYTDANINMQGWELLLIATLQDDGSVYIQLFAWGRDGSEEGQPNFRAFSKVYTGVELDGSLNIQIKGSSSVDGTITGCAGIIEYKTENQIPLATVTLTTTGSGAATYNPLTGVLNIPDNSGTGGGVEITDAGEIAILTTGANWNGAYGWECNSVAPITANEHDYCIAADSVTGSVYLYKILKVATVLSRTRIPLQLL